MKFEDVTIEGQNVDIDLNEYINVQFRKCVIFYRGLGLWRLESCSFDACNFQLDGPARLTMMYMQQLAQSANGRDLVESFFKAVLDGTAFRQDVTVFGGNGTLN